MSLLRDIQSSAVLSENKITDLLRKCKILAARLGNKDFEDWVDNELNGYKIKEQVPNYRKLKRVESKGHFAGYFRSGLRNAPIPPSCIDNNDIREFISTEYLMQGISAYEELLSGSSVGSFHVAWPADLVAHYGQNIYENMNCMEAWKEIPRGSIVEVIDSVRNRVLAFALEIEKVNPEAGEAPLNSEPIPQTSVSQIFHTHIYGNIGNYASGNQNSYQNIEINIRGDISGLKRELSKLGIEDADITALESALKEDEEKHQGKFGEKTASWISKMIEKAASGVGQLTIATASQLLPKLILNYFGLS